MTRVVRIIFSVLVLLQLGCFANVGIGKSINLKTFTEVPQSWGIKEKIQNLVSGDSTPTIFADDLPDILNDGRAEVYLDSECKTLVGSASISGNSFEVTNISITESFTEMGDKKFYGRYVSSTNLEGNCTDLSLSYFYRPNSSIISNYGNAFAKGPGNSVFMSDQGRAQIIHLDLDSNVRTMLYGRGVGSGVQLQFIDSIVYSSTLEKLFLTDEGLDAVVSIDTTSGERTVVSSSSVGSGTPFSAPGALVINQAGTIAYVFDSGFGAIIEVNLLNGDRSTMSWPGFVGTGNSYSVGGLEQMYLSLDEAKIYYTERSADRLSIVDIGTGNNSVVSSSSLGTGKNLDNPFTVMINENETKAYVLNSDSGGNDFFLEIDLVTGNRTELSGDEIGSGPSIDGTSASLLINDGNSLFVHSTDRKFYEVSIATGDRSVLIDFKTVASDYQLGSYMVVSDDESYAYSFRNFATDIMKTDLLTGTSSIITSNSVGTGATLNNLAGITINSSGSTVYLGDSGSSILNSTNTSITRFDTTSGTRTIVASSSVGSGPNFNFPSALTLTSDDSTMYFVDANLNALFSLNVSSGARSIVSQDGVIGSGPAFNNPRNVVLNAAETIAYVVNISGGSIYSVDLSTGNRTVISDSSTGSGPSLQSAYGLALDEANNTLYAGNGNSLYTGVIQVDIATGNRTTLFAEDEKNGPTIYNANYLKYNSTGEYLLAFDSNFDWILRADIGTGKTSLIVK